MRTANFIPAALLLCAGALWAQQELAPTADQGPLPIKPAQPIPDKDGVYTLQDGIAAPVLTSVTPATYPPDSADADHPHVCILSVVVGVDGVPTSVRVNNPNPGPFEESAIAAVKEARFQPGMFNAKPVPVLIRVRVPFFHFTPAFPKVLLHYGQMDNQQAQRDPNRMQPGDTPPKLIHNVEPMYSEQARRQKIQGVVMISMIVTEQGEPADLHVEKSLGYGLDEKALEAASKYRFKPALRDGNPIPMRITVEMNFRLY
jgi:TonB family protein